MKTSILINKIHIGIVSNEELASWFKVKPSTIENKKPMYLNKLSQLCWFEDIPGGVNILQLKFM